MSFITKSGLYAICYLVLFTLLDRSVSPAMAQDDKYALDVNTANCVADPNNEESKLLYNGALPSSLVVEDTMLLSQPPLTVNTRPLGIVLIPANAHVIVFGVDEQTQSYFRVVFPCEEYHLAGWVEASAVRQRVNRTNLQFAPPGCAHPLRVLTSLTDAWTSTIDGEIAVVVDLFRPEGGTEFPRSYFYLTKNDREMRDKEWVFQSSGAFLMRSVVFGTEVQVGNSIGFSVISTSNEELSFFGTVYLIPAGCPLLPYDFDSDWHHLSDFIVLDQRGLLGEVFSEQTGNIDNSTGIAPLSQDIAFQRAFQHSIDLRLSEDANLDRQAVEQHILETYDVPDQISETNCSIQADVPAGAIYQYEIEWSQILREGNIEEGSFPGQGRILGTYRIVIDLQCQTVGVHVVE